MGYRRLHKITTTTILTKDMTQTEENETLVLHTTKSSIPAQTVPRRRVSRPNHNTNLSSPTRTKPQLRQSMTEQWLKHSLLSDLWNKVQEKPDFKILSWVDDQCKEVSNLTFAELWEQSGAVQQLLQEKDLKPGDRVMICYPFGLEFLAGFFGAIRAGVIPCSIYPPNPKQPKASIKTFANMAKDAGAKFALTTKQFQHAMGLLQVAGHRPGVTWIATDSLKPVAHLPFVEPNLDSPAFIQYTSGSTSAPKGVVISHRAIAHSIHVTTQCMTDFKMDVEKTRYQIVSWLPQYHDMGLMNGFLMPLVSGAPCVNTSPLNFIKNPLIWAYMIEKYKATSIVSPNFGYGLLAKRLQQAGRTMDASTITTAVNAAEPVSVVTLKQMVDVLGIQTTALLPAYGAAESVAIVGGNRGIETNEDGFVACGDISESLLFEKSIVILDDSKQMVADGTVGRIHFTGPDLASGYWGNPKLTEEAFKVKIAGSNDDRFYYDSGDLGMIQDGKLFITGRAKELIIINGVNKYPTDLEHSVEAAFPETVRPGCCVAFQYNKTQVGCVLELRKTIQGSQAPSVDEIKSVLVRENAITVDYVAILKAHTIPKTTSGKLRRLEAAAISHSGKWPQRSVITQWKSGRDAFGGKTEPAKIVPTRGANMEFGQKLSSLVAEVAGVEVSQQDAVASLGLSSMDLVKLQGLVIDELGLAPEDLPLDWFFDGELTLEVLASRILIACGTASNAQQQDGQLAQFEHRDASALSPPLFVAFVRGVIQFVVLLIPPVFLAAIIYPSALFVYWTNSQYGTKVALLVLPISTLIYTLTAAALLIGMKWILLGKQKPSVSGVWSGQFARRWLVRQCSRICWRITPWAYLGGTSALALLHRCLGSKLGKGISLEPGCIEDYDLVEVGDFSSISGTILTEMVSLGVQTTFWTKIGCHSVVSSKAIISPNVKIEDNVTVGIRCAVPPSVSLERGTEWVGKPAKKHHWTDDSEATSVSSSSIQKKWVYSIAQYVSIFISGFLFFFEFWLALFVGMTLWENLGWMGFAPLIWVPATLALLGVWILTASMKLLLLGKLEEGSWPLYGSFHCRKFLVDHLVEAHLLQWLQIAGIFGSPLAFSSQVSEMMLRSLGASLHDTTVIPQDLWTAYDLVQCSEGVQFSGGLSLHIFSEQGNLLVANSIVIGKNVFLGTSAALVAPLVLEDGATVAAHSVARGRVASNETVLNMAVMKGFSDQHRDQNVATSLTTIKSDVPALAAGMTMLAFIVLVMSLASHVGLFFNGTSSTVNEIPVAIFVAVATAGFSFAVALILPMFVALMLLISKNAVIGTYRPLVVHHGSLKFHMFEWAQILKMKYERVFMDAFSGTFLEVLFHRLMGAHLGKGVYLDGVYFFEHDLVHIGSYTSITGWVGLAPHHFHDRQGKDTYAKLEIGARCNIRCDATLHGNDIVDDDTTLDVLSMPLVGSRLTTGTWCGYPATRVGGVEPMPARPPTPLWYVLLQRPSALVYGAAFFIFWGLHCFWDATIKHMLCANCSVQSSLEIDDTFPLEQDTEAGIPSFVGNGTLVPDLSTHVDKESIETVSGRLFEEFNSESGSWEPLLRMLNIRVRAKGTWWEWACFVCTFDSEFKRAHVDISLYGWTIPSELLSARLEHVDGHDCWILSLSLLEGEPEQIVLKRKAHVSVVDPKARLVDGAMAEGDIIDVDTIKVLKL